MNGGSNFAIGVSLASMLLVGAAAPSRAVAQPALRPEPSFGSIPLYFIPNRGQADARALFSARAEGFTLWATREGLIFDQRGHGDGAGSLRASRPAQLGFGGTVTPGAHGPEQLGRRGAVTHLMFLGARPDVEVSAEGETAHRANFFLGQDPARWRTNIPTSPAIRYNGLYPGIDLKVYGAGRRIEYDWFVSPGADPAAVRLRFERCRATRLDPEGNLVVDSAAGGFTHKKPAAYQEIGGRRVAVACRYERLGAGTYGFQVGRYDCRRPLVIDPLVIVWSSFIGGSDNDRVSSLAVDPEGVVWVTGETESSYFPLTSPLDSTLGGESDLFVSAIVPAGGALLFSTYIGGADKESGAGIAVDPAGRPAVCGLTASRNFPVKNACDPTFNGGSSDAFLLKLSSSGDKILFSTYLGGKESDSARCVAFDGTGRIAVAGSTSSPDFPAVKGFDKTFNNRQDGFVAKFTADGRRLLFSTFLGGNDEDIIRGLALDAQGRIHVAGYTGSSNFPVKKALFPARRSAYDGFVTILAATGKTLAASTFIGGRGYDLFYDLALDKRNFIYLAGTSNSPDFPVKAAYDPVPNGDSDGVILKLKPLAAGIVFSTYFGSPDYDYLTGLAVGAAGDVFVAGGTKSSRFPVKNPYDATLGGPSDAVLAGFSPSGKTLAFSTYLGGAKDEEVSGLRLDSAGDLYVFGKTESKNYPLKREFDSYYSDFRGPEEGFITRLRRR